MRTLRHLSSHDVADLLQLFGELVELRTADERRIHASRRLCGLLRARAGGFCTVRLSLTAKDEPAVADVEFVGHTAAEKERLERFFRDADQFQTNPIARHVQARLCSSTSQSLFVSRPDVASIRRWRMLPYVNEVLRPANVDDFLSGCWLPDGERRYSYLTVRRAWGDRCFSPRERALFAHFHAFAGRFLATKPRSVEDGRPAGRVLDWPRMTPRRRLVLEGLLQGESEKEIARRIGRSRHTVHRHVMWIYRAMGVSSRSELMARFVTRGAASDVGNEIPWPSEANPTGG